MRMTIAAIMLAAVLATPAFADMETMTLASNLGNVLAAEESCGLAYKPEAIEAWIAKNVPASDMSFNGNLNMMTVGAGVQIRKMSASQKTANCAQVKRTAKHYGFID